MLEGLHLYTLGEAQTPVKPLRLSPDCVAVMELWCWMTAQVYIGLLYLFTGVSMSLTAALYVQPNTRGFMKKQR